MVSDFSIKPLMVGREQEINRLLTILDDLLAGKGSLVFIGGEAGVGKTRLVNEFLDRAREKGVKILSGWCLSEVQVPYFPFIEAFNKYITGLSEQKEKTGITDKLGLTGWLRGPERILEPDKDTYSLSPIIENERTFDTVARILQDLSMKEPHILFIDDLQWADQLSLGMIHYLAKKCRDSKFLIIGTYRTEDITKTTQGTHPLQETIFSLSRNGLYNKIDLQPLEATDFPAMLNSIFNTTFGIEFVDLLYDETEGNPLFAIETLNLLVEEGTLEEQGEEWRLTSQLENIRIPSKIQDLVYRRIVKLDRDQRRILELAAVSGRSINPEILCRVLSIGLVDVYESLVDIERTHKIIRSVDFGFEFTHQKIKEVIYEDTQIGLRRLYHLQTANILEQVLSEKISDGYLAEIAYHYVEGESPEKAFKYLIRLGEQARTLYANREAIDYLSKALEIAEKNPNLATGEQLYTIYKIRGGAIEAITADFKLSLDAKDDYIRMLEAAKNLDDKKLLAEAYSVIGSAYNPYFSEAETRAKYCHQGLSLAREVGDKRLIAKILLDLAYIDLLRPDQVDDGLEKLREASKLSKETGAKVLESYSLRLLGGYYKNTGDFQLAKEALEPSIILMQEFFPAHAHSLVFRYMFMCAALTQLGEYDKALEYGMKGIKIGNDYEITSFIWILNTVGWIYYHLGDVDKAIEYCNESINTARERGKRSGLGGVPYSLSILGRLYLELEDYEKAKEYLEEALETSHLHASHREFKRLRAIIDLSLCELRFAQFRDEQVLEKVNEIIRLTEKARAKKYQAQSLVLKAKILAKKGKLDEAYQLMEKALQLAEKMNSPHILWRTHNVLGDIYYDNNEPQKAQEQYRIVVKLFEETAGKLQDKSLKDSLLSKRIYQDVCTRLSIK